ncbi:MAG: Dyp-type peroxidase [Acidimicrobiia bacterium]
MIRATSPLDHDDIQGNVLRGYGFPAAAYVFVSVEDGAAGRKWLGGLVEPVTTDAEWTEGAPAAAVNVAVTAAGLAALGVPQRLRATFDTAFLEGARARAEHLGDRGPSDPSRWHRGLGDGSAHILVTVNVRDRETLGDHVAPVLEGVGAPGSGLAVVHRREAALLGNRRDHFGFADGFAQPHVEDGDSPATARWKMPKLRRDARLMKPGEFVLGYEDEDGVLPDAPAPPLGKNGTYAVYRELHQDVAAFRRFLNEKGPAFGGGEVLAAKIVGRWRDGTPLALSPDRPDPGISQDRSRIDDFDYSRDPEGYRCPLGAHIRRTNPRDALGWGDVRSKRHRIIRRGMPYGQPLAEDAVEDDGAERGLAFVCFNASLERQFETIQRQWCNDGNIFGLGRDRDFLLGGPEGEGKMTIQGHQPRFLAPPLPFVQTRGAEYLFFPGIDALRALAAGFPGV